MSDHATKDEAIEAAIAELRREARREGEALSCSLCVGPPCRGEAPAECLLCDVLIVEPDGSYRIDTNQTKQ